MPGANGNVRPIVRAFPLALAVVLLLVAATVASRSAVAAIERPTYAAGDRWVYVLAGSLHSLPGLNASQIANLALVLEGRVEVGVKGSVERTVGGTRVPGVEVETRTTAFLNGSFSVPGGPFPVPATVTGTLTDDLVEVWETSGYFAIETKDATTYAADVTYLVTTRLNVDVRANASTTVVPDRTFPLSVGQRASASLTSDLTVNVTFTAFGMTSSQENRTTVASSWTRHVLSEENSTVEAGTFRAYRLNQSVGFFPGLTAASALASGNETAFWSNDVGYYVRRAVYANGTQLAELRLKSYSYGPAQSAPPYLWIAIGAIAAAVAVAALVWRRRRRQKAAPAAAVGTHLEPPSGTWEPGEGGRAR